MPNLTPTSSFDDVPELETATLALGGPGGPMNLPAQALLNRTQWLKDNAVAGSSSPYAVGTGTASACAAAYTPAITALADGMKLRFVAAATNTGAATFAPDALTAQPIVGGAYAALQGGEILAGGEVELTWNATLGAWVITAQAGGSPQVPDATQSKQAASKAQVDQITTDLASTATGKGASLVGFLQNGAGSVPATMQNRERNTIWITDFAADGISGVPCDPTGVVDSTAGIQAAIDYAVSSGIRRIYDAGGTYKITAQLNVTSPVLIIGAGNGFLPINGPVAATTGTTFKWAGTTGTVMLQFLQCNSANHGLCGITLDGNSIASTGLVVDSCMSGNYDHVTVINCLSQQLYLTCSTVSTCSWNTFRGLNLDSSSASNYACLDIGTVGTATANPCHNTFINTRINHGGNGHGIRLGDCDNITFIMTYIYHQPASTGYGVYCDSTQNAGFPGTCVFVHLQAMAGWFQDAGCTHRVAAIYGYQTDNGEPLPTFGGTAYWPLMADDGGNIYGVRSLQYSAIQQTDLGSSQINSGASSVVISGLSMPNTSYQVVIKPKANIGSGVCTWVDSKTTSQFTVHSSAALGGNWPFDWEIKRTDS